MVLSKKRSISIIYTAIVAIVAIVSLAVSVYSDHLEHTVRRFSA